ncbi:hypothetical protein M378DRAFT_26410 [Amanita muscaria Koide BX008]|uniref:Uncharacterized protein n=1 Tax=Amanita muscaria (strain Koide BX008) TaxID=946122 RepID=A0A0C2T2K8_AMAMK|nr:hypothetical protein M378DRAFT_26410 [Amanita muscaria Koide BX008]
MNPDESQPRPKRQKLDTAMDTTPSSHPLPPDSRSEFDSKVLACAEGRIVHAVTLDDTEIVILLIAILKTDRELVQDTSIALNFGMDGLSQAMNIVREHPELPDDLQEAWTLKKFEKIRRLPFLQAPSQVQRGDGRHHTPDFIFLQEAWKEPYQTQAHQVLYKSICEMSAGDEGPYKNILAIIQSSGYGKTRMLDEHAKLVFTFPFVVRNPSETTESAYPHPDQCVHEFLTTFGNTEEEIMAGYYKFFTTLFTRAVTIIEEHNKKEANSQPQSLPEWWRGHLAESDNRKNLYSEVVEETKATITPSSSVQSEIQKGDNQSSSSAQSEIQKGNNQPKLPERRGGPRAVNAARSLLNVITPVLEEKAVQAVIYFDEAHELANHNVGSRKDRNRLDVLYACLDAFSRLPIMFIFTSTTSSLYRLAPPRAGANSGRRVAGDSVDQAPITELPFDCHPSLPLDPNVHSFQAICELEFLARFGRPLFWTLLNGGESEEHVLTLAKNKLAPQSHKIYHGSDHLDLDPTYSLTAIIDLLLMLDYNPDHKTAQEVQKKLVESHMRTSEAAMAKLAQILHPKPEKTYPDGVIDTVNAHFSQGLLHSGDLGELAARMLLINAYMSACKKASRGTQVIYSKGCKLDDFLRSLFQKSEIVLEAKSDNIFDGPTLKDAFKDAVVRFTHFGKFVDNTATSQNAAHAAFFRSMAIICRDTQESVDIIIPVLSTTDGVVCRHAISSILIQVKGAYIQRNKKLELPYINFVLDLGVRTRPASTQAAAPPTRPLRKPPNHYRYTIYARGLSSYCSVTAVNLPKYERLLCLSNLLGDHSRQSSSHLEMVRRLKPFWARGEAFHWLNNEALTVHPTPIEGDALEVGTYESEDDT